MSTFIEQPANPPKKIDTSMFVNTGYFGTALLEYGVCHIGTEIWIKHGLTEEDKKAFEDYQNGWEEIINPSIDDPDWSAQKILELLAYERDTPSEKCLKIMEIIVEIDAKYKIGNWESYVFEEEEDLSQKMSYVASLQEDEEDMGDWYERQREIRYQHEIENCRDDYDYDSN